MLALILLRVGRFGDGDEANRVRSNKIPAQCGADVVYIDVVLQAESLAGRLYGQDFFLLYLIYI